MHDKHRCQHNFIFSTIKNGTMYIKSIFVIAFCFVLHQKKSAVDTHRIIYEKMWSYDENIIAIRTCVWI